jgi:hypothetical protein
MGHFLEQATVSIENSLALLFFMILIKETNRCANFSEEISGM